MHHPLCVQRMSLATRWLPLPALLALVLCCCHRPLSGAEGPGARSFQRGIPLESVAGKSASVSAGDVNGDGHSDLLLIKGRHWPEDNLILLGNGDGSFQAPALLGGPANRSYSGVLVDLDADGDLDVVLSNDSPDPKLVYHNDGVGQFTAGASFGLPEWSTRYVSVADLNADNFPDIITANRHGRQAGPLYICWGAPGATFSAQTTVFAHGSATTITPVDINGDGAVDLVVPYRDGGQSVVILNDGSGGFEQRLPFGPADAHIRSALPCDLNADGLIDLAAIDVNNGPQLYWGSADGGFSAATPLGSSTATPYALYVSDIDQDGRTDIIVGFHKAQPVVFFNDGPTGFSATPFGDADGKAYGFAVADFNEDGLQDIAMARSGAPNVLYLGSP